MQNKQNHNSEPKPNWKIATEQDKNEFFNEINVQLNKVAVPDVVQNCKDVQCNHTQHRYESDVYVLDILHEIEQAAFRKLPIPRNKTSNNILMKAIPRWKEDIAPYKDNALFWNSVWNSAGKPHNTELHNIMKRTRNLYHFHIRKNKRMLDKIKRNKLLNACLNSENGIFREIKSMRRNKSTHPNANTAFYITASTMKMI